jgi:hypothetical protein
MKYNITHKIINYSFSNPTQIVDRLTEPVLDTYCSIKAAEKAFMKVFGCYTEEYDGLSSNKYTMWSESYEIQNCI